MKTNENLNTGTTETAVETNVNVNAAPKKRGRKIDPNKTRRIYLTPQGEGEKVTYVTRGKGAPKPNSVVYFVTVQRNTPIAGFVFNPETMKIETETLGARNYKQKQTQVETQVVAPVTPTVHESANGTVITENADSIVVEANATGVTPVVA